MARPRPVAIAILLVVPVALAPAAPGPAAAAAKAKASAAKAKAERAQRDAFAPRLCAARPRCRITDVTDVGRDAAGHPLHVVTVRLDDEDAAGEMDGCATAEHWLVAGAAARPASRQLLASGYAGECGAVGDEATLAAGRFSYEDFCGGGHPDHYNHQWTLSLSPLGRVSETGFDAERLPDTNAVDYTWSWQTFSGTGKATYFKCDATGQGIEGDDGPSGPSVAWVTIPALPAHASPAHLGGCATFVDGASGGFTIHGAPGTAADAQFRAVIAGRQLLLEVTDDHWVGPGKDWTFDDHVELWLSKTASPQQLDRCEDLHAAGALQWGIRIADGAVFAAYGHPTDKLAVTRSPAAPKDGQPVQLAITLPRWFDPAASGITVVYSDSDDGATQKRLISTSQLQFGKRWTIGRARVIRRSEATCSEQAGRLEPVPSRAFHSGKALIDLGYE